MKTQIIKIILFSILFLYSDVVFAQNAKIDSLEKILQTNQEDTLKINTLNAISNEKIKLGDLNDAKKYTELALTLAKKIGFKKGIADSYTQMGNVFNELSDYSLALEYFQKALIIDEQIGNKAGIAQNFHGIGIVYHHLADDRSFLEYEQKSLFINQQLGNKQEIATNLNCIGIVYLDTHELPKALEYYRKSLSINEQLGNKDFVAANRANIGVIYRELSDYPKALLNLQKALKINEEIGDKILNVMCNINIGEVYQRIGKHQEALKYETKALSLAMKIGAKESIKYVYGALSEIDSSMNNFKDAYKYHKLYMQINDSIFNIEKEKKITALQMQFDFDKKQVADSLTFAQEKEVSKIKLQKQKAFTYGGFIGIAITILLLFFVYRNYTKQRIANQKLKEAQQQLIKSEKMAAFGMMASRVSHEIQNPLNFVNNFSELSQEMLTDVISSTNEEDKQQNTALLFINLQKINEQSRKASEIVKQLQEHSRKGSAHEYFEEN